MTTRRVNGRSLLFQQLTKNTNRSNYLPISRNSRVAPNSQPPYNDLSYAQAKQGQIPIPLEITRRIPVPNQSSSTVVRRTEIPPKSRIVVVRTTSGRQSENGEIIEESNDGQEKSVDLPAMYTNGRTSVYLIRRPIPPPEPPRETKLFLESGNLDEVTRTVTKTRTPVAGTGIPASTETYVERVGNNADTNFVDDVEQSHESIPYDETDHIPDYTPSEPSTLPAPAPAPAPAKRPKTSKFRSFFSRSRTPPLSPSNIDTNNPFNPSPTMTYSESSKDLLSSSPKSSDSKPSKSQPKPKSKLRTQTRIRLNPKGQSGSKSRPSSPPLSAPLPPPVTPPPPAIEKPRKSFVTSTRMKSIAVQANVQPPEPMSYGEPTTQPISPIMRKPSLPRKPPNQRIKSSKSMVLVNPNDNTIAVIENPYMKGERINPSKLPRTLKRIRVEDDMDIPSTEKLTVERPSYTCIGCLSRNICLIIIVCTILIVVGLAGAGVSSYFLATDTQSNLIPKIVGIAVGALLAIAALLFCCCVVGCIGYHDGYFSYNHDYIESGGRAFALISPSHPNANLYIPKDDTKTFDYNRLTHVSSNSRNPDGSIPTKYNRKKSMMIENVNPGDPPNISIEIPEQLLTGRKLSPRSHERKINKVVSNIGTVVDDARKRYQGDPPSKVIVKVDRNG